jgi:hypothetical protein
VDRRLFDADPDPDPAFNIVAYPDPVHMLENQQFFFDFYVQQCYFTYPVVLFFSPASKVSKC